MTLYLLAVCAVTVAICLIEGDSFSLGNIIYEVASAIATVGLTQGITPLLSVASKIILCFAMYFGRLGGLTLLLAIAEKQPGASLERPYEKILIG
jgi:trk system potassium uptake protein TrkH